MSFSTFLGFLSKIFLIWLILGIISLVTGSVYSSSFIVAEWDATIKDKFFGFWISSVMVGILVLFVASVLED